jgi:hypothetical protein
MFVKQIAFETEIDEEQTESRRLECMTTIKDLEVQFSKLKDELIQEKLRLIETKLRDIENETAREFQVPINKLKENLDLKLNILGLLKEYRLKNIENTFLCDETSAKQSVENDKTMLFDSIKSKIENEIKEIEENRRLLYLELKKKEDYFEAAGQSANIQSISTAPATTTTAAAAAAVSSFSTSQTTAPATDTQNSFKRKSQQKFSTADEFDRRKKTTTVSDILLLPSPNFKNFVLDQNIFLNCSSPRPYLVYSLPEWDILEDWSIIKRVYDKNKFEPQHKLC